MRDKVSIGLIVYFLACGISLGCYFWKIASVLALLLSIPMVGGAILAFYLKKIGGR